MGKTRHAGDLDLFCFGIVIRMAYREHGVRRSDAEYREQQTAFTFDGKILAGALRCRLVLRLIEEWARSHREALEANWHRMKEDCRGTREDRASGLRRRYGVSPGGDSS